MSDELIKIIEDVIEMLTARNVCCHCELNEAAELLLVKAKEMLEKENSK